MGGLHQAPETKLDDGVHRVRERFWGVIQTAPCANHSAPPDPWRKLGEGEDTNKRLS